MRVVSQDAETAHMSQVEHWLVCSEGHVYCGVVRGDEERVVAAFANWLRHDGWTVDTEVDFIDVCARRGDERLYAEVSVTSGMYVFCGTMQSPLYWRLKNDKGRRRDASPVAARGPAPGGVDRPASGPAAPRAAAPPGRAGPAGHPAAQPDPPGGGRFRLRPVRQLLVRARPRLAGRAGSCPRCRGRSSPTAWR